MSKFLIKFSKFFILILIFPLVNLILDPFDYYEHPFKVKFNRIEKTRIFNVADWTLSELKKISPTKKNSTTILSVGDSRGQSLMTDGFRGGWKKRTFRSNKENVYDLSFGGARVEEMNSLLLQELPKCPKVKKIIYVFSIDRVLEQDHFGNRIKTSPFNSKFPNLTYLFNPRNILTFGLASFEKTRAKEMTKKEFEAKHQSIIQKFLTIYKLNSKKNADKFIKQFRGYINELKNYRQLDIIIIIPPYKKDFYDNLMEKYKDKYQYALSKLKTLGVPIIYTQSHSELFTYTDAVHGKLTKGHILNDIEAFK